MHTNSLWQNKCKWPQKRTCIKITQHNVMFTSHLRQKMTPKLVSLHKGQRTPRTWPVTVTKHMRLTQLGANGETRFEWAEPDSNGRETEGGSGRGWMDVKGAGQRGKKYVCGNVANVLCYLTRVGINIDYHVVSPHPVISCGLAYSKPSKTSATVSKMWYFCCV